MTNIGKQLMDARRFKIDFYPHARSNPFGLYYMKPGWWQDWMFVECFEDRDKAFAFYEKVKDLPEYLP